jgi:hypothetical protein
MSLINRKKIIIPEPKGIIEGYQQVFNGAEDWVTNNTSLFLANLAFLLRDCLKVADEYNDVGFFETDPYTFIPPKSLLEFYLAKYLRNQLDKERWNLLFKKPINGIASDIRLVEKEDSNNHQEKKRKLRTIIIDLFAELWLYPMYYKSDFIVTKADDQREMPTISLDEFVAEIKRRIKSYNISPEDYYIILPIINVVGKGEGIDLEELANRLGIPRKNIIILANESTKLKLTEELDTFISFLQSLEILFEIEN